MFDFDAMATFVEVAQLGSFSAAAKALRLPRSTVSERVARLEASLGVRLLERTTRVVRPTSAGAAYHERCARILSEMEEANAAVKDLESSPRGVLRVATPLLFGQSFLASVAAAFTQSHPAVEIEIVASDRPVNPIEDGFDVAIMLFASDDDSSLIAQRLTGGDLWLCATPSYLEARGRPKSPADLDEHTRIVYGESRVTRWTFERGREVRRVDVRGTLSMNSFAMLHEAVRTGVGIAPVEHRCPRPSGSVRFCSALILPDKLTSAVDTREGARLVAGKRAGDHGLIVQQRSPEKFPGGRIAGRIPSCSALR